MKKLRNQIAKTFILCTHLSSQIHLLE
ncbi:hypothetical protein [Granulicatella seriolae]